MSACHVKAFDMIALWISLHVRWRKIALFAVEILNQWACAREWRNDFIVSTHRRRLVQMTSPFVFTACDLTNLG